MNTHCKKSTPNLFYLPYLKKGAPAMQAQDPAMMHMMNAYQMQSQGYPVYDAMAMQQHPGQQQQQQQQLQQQQLQQYPEDYTHYPHPEEYLNERNQQFLNGGEFYRHIPRPDGNSDCKFFFFKKILHSS